jgi:hypothetical protein
VSNPYGYVPQDARRPGPPPGVLPPPQAAPWQQGPPPQYQAPGAFPQRPAQYPPQGQYPGQWAQPYYGGPNQFNGFQPPKRRGGAVKFVMFGFFALAFVGITLAVIGAILTGGSTTAEPEPSGPSIVPTATNEPQEGSAEDFLLNSPLYTAGGLGELNCPAEKLGDGSLAAQKRYYQKLFGCLNDAWRPVFGKLGIDKPDPGLVVFDQQIGRASCRERV